MMINHLILAGFREPGQVIVLYRFGPKKYHL